VLSLETGGNEVTWMSESSADDKRMTSSRFEAALIFAIRLHADQTRKGTNIPYIAHLLGVASIVLEYGGNEDEAIAALLHDAIEDTNATRQEICDRFGEEVAAIVHGSTDTDKKPKPDWWPRKRAYIERIPNESKSVLLVSAADKLENARAILADYRRIGESLWDRFNGKKEGTLWYYRSLANAYGMTGGHRGLIDELNRVVSEIERLVEAQGATTV
jgi:(p)ppGpp synthase/HD superfamily hydrolase